MALQQACYVENGKAVGGVVPDASSAIGYKENVGGTCANPNGYTAGSYFMASNNGYMYEALTNIAHGDAFQIGTNCKQTNVSTELNEINQHLTELSQKVEGMGMKVLKYGTFSSTTNINLDTPLDPSKYMVNIQGIGSGAYPVNQAPWIQKIGGAYVSAKTSTSVTISCDGNWTGSYEIIQIAN